MNKRKGIHRYKDWSFGLKRKNLLKHAAAVFNRKGYHGTTISDIAREVGVSPSALYYYVKDKEQVLFECNRMSLDLAMDALNTACATATTAEARLELALRGHIEALTDEMQACVVLIEEDALSERYRKKIIKRRDEYERALRGLIQEGIEEKVFIQCDPKIVGFAFLGAINWIPKWYSAKGEFPPGEIARLFAQHLVRSILVSPKDSPILPCDTTERILANSRRSEITARKTELLLEGNQ